LRNGELFHPLASEQSVNTMALMICCVDVDFHNQCSNMP